MTSLSFCLSISVTPETLLAEFDAIQQQLMLGSWISLDYRAQQDMRDELVSSVVEELAGDFLLRDLLCGETRPHEAFLFYARRQMAVRLVECFGWIENDDARTFVHNQAFAKYNKI